MSDCILDASALLTLLNSENGAETIKALLPYSVMGTVNVAEVIAELDKKLNISSKESQKMISKMINQIIPLDFAQAIEIGRLRRLTQSLGLSLGDRACIALGIKLNLPVYSADRIWKSLQIVNLDIKLIR